MLETIGAATGGLLGQMGDALSAPRRALWSALGMPEDGAHLLSDTFGMDPDSLLTKGLGFGAEMALDPLTYLGIPLGGALGKLGMGGGEALAGEIEGLTAARRAAQEAMVNRAAAEEATAAAQAQRFEGMRGVVDPASMAEGATRHYPFATDAANDYVARTGLGDAGRVSEGGLGRFADGEEIPGLQGGDEFLSAQTGNNLAGRGVRHSATLHQGRVPTDMKVSPVRNAGEGKGRMAGKALDVNRGDGLQANPLLGEHEADPLANAPWRNGESRQPLPPGAAAGPLTPYERYLVMREGNAAGPGPLSIHSPDVLSTVGALRGSELNAARGVPSLAEAMGQAAMPKSAIDTVGGMGLAGLPIDQGFERAQALLADALARQKAARLSGLEKAAIGGAGVGAFGGGLASYLGDR